MLTCDICKKTIEGRRDIRTPIKLPYVYTCSAWQVKEFDVCSDCERILSAVITQVKCDFANGKYTESEVRD